MKHFERIKWWEAKQMKTHTEHWPIKCHYSLSELVWHSNLCVKTNGALWSPCSGTKSLAKTSQAEFFQTKLLKLIGLLYVSRRLTGYSILYNEFSVWKSKVDNIFFKIIIWSIKLIQKFETSVSKLISTKMQYKK